MAYWPTTAPGASCPQLRKLTPHPRPSVAQAASIRLIYIKAVLCFQAIFDRPLPASWSSKRQGKVELNWSFNRSAVILRRIGKQPEQFLGQAIARVACHD